MKGKNEEVKHRRKEVSCLARRKEVNQGRRVLWAQGKKLKRGRGRGFQGINKRKKKKKLYAPGT